MKMKIFSALTIFGLCLIFVAGCTSPSGSGVAAGSTAAATPSGGTGSPVQTQSPVVTLTNGSYAINVTLDQIEIDKSDDGSRKVSVYLTVRNSGLVRAQYRWYSTLTNADGASFGGVGVSHGGSGAESAPLYPGSTGSSARDYVVIPSDKDYAALSKGATLGVFFTTEPLTTDETPVTFSGTWTLDPALFT